MASDWSGTLRAPAVRHFKDAILASAFEAAEAATHEGMTDGSQRDTWSEVRLSKRASMERSDLAAVTLALASVQSAGAISEQTIWILLSSLETF